MSMLDTPNRRRSAALAEARGRGRHPASALRRAVRRVLASVAFAAFASAVALGATAVDASAQTGTIAGRVRDSQGVPVPGATVTAKSPDTGFARTEPSDSEGLYRLSALPVGGSACGLYAPATRMRPKSWKFGCDPLAG